MYRRFLNDKDYLSVISEEHFNLLVKNNTDRLVVAEQAAEASIIEYLSENYEIDKALNVGRYIAEYSRSITYPVGVHIYMDNNIYEVIRSISSYKKPSIIEYWSAYNEYIESGTVIPKYSQFNTYYKDDIVEYNSIFYICLSDNGFKFNNIRIPLVNGWKEVETSVWLPIEYQLWDVVSFNDEYYTLMSLDNFDNNINPFDSDNWGAIADYSEDYNNYEFSDNEYVVYENKVFSPEIDVNSDIPEIGKNLSLHEPRNFNLKKHMVRIAIYELTKIIAPNNVSIIRIKDYEESMKWLSDVSKLKINPQIPRKLDSENKPVSDWQLSTFQSDYNPHKNAWHI